MPRKKKISPLPEIPPAPVPNEHEKELALEEKEVQLEERKLAVWKQKFEFWKSAGRDTIILVTGIAGTVGGGALRTFLGYLDKATAQEDEMVTPPPPPPKVGDSHDLMPPPPPSKGGNAQVTLTPPDVLFGKQGAGSNTGQGYGSGSGQVGVANPQQYQPLVLGSGARHQHKNSTLYLMGNGVWIFFMLMVAWGIWRHFRKGKTDGAPTDAGGKPTGPA